MSRVLGDSIRIHGCSRTDRGVHALDQTASFTPPADNGIPADNFRRAVNAVLPPDIRVRSVEPVPPEFHARHDAAGKAYTYVLFSGRELTSPFCARYCWQHTRPLDIAAMRHAAALLPGTHDYTGFAVKSKESDRDPVKTLYAVHMKKAASFVVITVIGNAFLYRMVRRLTGFLVAVGHGTIAPDAVALVLQQHESSPSFDTAPPQGLFLERVFYAAADMAPHTARQLPFLAFLDIPDTMSDDIHAE